VKRRHGGACLLAGFLVFCLGCGAQQSPTGGSASPDGSELLFYCGAGLKQPVEEVVRQFENKHGITVRPDFAGSEFLLGRIKLRQEGDLFMPGDVQYVDAAEQKGLISAKRNVCYFIPVILVQKDNPHDIKSLEDLLDPDGAGLRIGFGDPNACAIGRKTLALLKKNGIEEGDLNVVTRTLTVNDLCAQVELKQLDAAIVWDGIAHSFADSADIVAIPRQHNVISTVAIGQLSCSKKGEAAAKFLDFITSDEGRAIFKENGFTTHLPE